MEKYKVAVVGCGNVGARAVEGVVQAPDMELAGIVERAEICPSLAQVYPCPVVDNVDKLGQVHGVILTIPSALVPQVAPDYLGRGIATADCFDMHGQPMLDLLARLGEAAQKAGVQSVSAAGWDPGTDSLIRAIFQIMAPQGITHTNFGPGMSMGHTVAVKKFPGVRDALSMTIPAGRGVHRREVYVELEPQADFERIREQIIADPYFCKDATTVTQVADVASLLDLGHGVALERRGVACGVHNQHLQFASRITNPAVTAQVMVAALRAVLRQKPGAYVMLELPLLDFLPGERRQLIRDLC